MHGQDPCIEPFHHYRGEDVQGRPDVVLRVFLTAFDDVPEDVQGAPELLIPDCDEDEPVVLRLPPCDVPVALSMASSV